MAGAPSPAGLSARAGVPLLLICLAGAAGTAARYAVGSVAARWWGAELPYGTLVVNVSGSFLIGLTQQLALLTGAIPEPARVALTVGFLGGFTTYSAFSYETIELLGRGVGPAVVYVLITTTLCLGACVAGIEAARALARP